MTNDNIIQYKRSWQGGPHIDRRGESVKEESPVVAEGKTIPSLIIVISLIACFVMGCNRLSHADEVSVDMKKIAMIESSGCKHKVGDDGKSNGCHQISSGTLKEYNQFNRTKYTKKDLMNDAVSLKVASWYANKRIPALLKHFGQEDTVTNRLIAYNSGIKAVINGKIPKVTKSYLKKYAV